MKFIELVKSRRSVRAFDKRKVERKSLELCIEAASFAPSACNSQPWNFIIVDEDLTKEKIAKNVFSGLYGMNAFACEASAYIAVISEKVKFFSWLGSKFRSTNFREIDIGIACEHILLQAHELGIGTCLLGWFNEKELKKILSVPRTKKIELVIALGYPAQASVKDKYLKDKSKIISYNKY